MNPCMNKILRLLCLSSSVAMMAIHTLEAAAKNDKTRGIGIYPGNPAEYFGPQVVADGLVSSSWEARAGLLPSMSARRTAMASLSLNSNILIIKR